MPKRQTVVKHKSDEIQGDGSYVVLSAIKVREIREIRRKEKEESADTFEEGMKILKNHIVGWNWVDDEGEPLPLPKEDSEVIDELTEDEATFLVNLLMGSEEEKN